MAIAAFNCRSESRGFTMIELMVSVAIVGILAAIALPPYFDFVTRSKLIDGTKALLDFKRQIDQYGSDNRSYLNGVACGLPNPLVTPADHFTITCGPPVPTATTYTLVATGIVAKGTGGFRFQVDNTDARSSAGPPGWANGIGCWAMRKDGSCS